MTTDMTVIDANASMVPIKTRIREYFIDRSADMKNVLSPISLASTSKNAAVSPETNDDVSDKFRNEASGPEDVVGEPIDTPLVTAAKTGTVRMATPTATAIATRTTACRNGFDIKTDLICSNRVISDLRRVIFRTDTTGNLMATGSGLFW